MKTIKHRILEFGNFNFEIIVEALKIYKKNNINNNINDIPEDFTIDEKLINQNIGYTEKFEDLNLYEALLTIKNGDCDGFDVDDRNEVYLFFIIIICNYFIYFYYHAIIMLLSKCLI
jgi:hypothetical protein